MKSLLTLCLSFLTACSGVSVVGYPIDDGYRVQRTISDPHAFAPSVQTVLLEVCKQKTETPGFWYHSTNVDYSQCSRDGQIRYNTASGYLDGLGAAALYSGAIVGGAALIGNGIAQSGSNVNQAGGGANAVQNQLSNQTQGQLQLQNQSQHLIAPKHGGY